MSSTHIFRVLITHKTLGSVPVPGGQQRLPGNVPKNTKSLAAKPHPVGKLQKQSRVHSQNRRCHKGLQVRQVPGPQPTWPWPTALRATPQHYLALGPALSICPSLGSPLLPAVMGKALWELSRSKRQSHSCHTCCSL